MQPANQKLGAALRPGLIFLLLCGAASHVSIATAQSRGTFTATGSMITARAGHTATLLPDGKVLIAGGWQTTDGVLPLRPVVLALASVELYDPSSSVFTAAGSLSTARVGHTATPLTDGRVLITGGSPSFGSGPALSHAELYDPSAGTFTATGDMSTGRQWHTATLLNNGKVLIAGGLSDGPGASSKIWPPDRFYVAGAELYDPSTGTFTATGDMTKPRYYHTAILLPSGKVLIEGGFDASGSAEIYDPEAGAFSLTASAPDANTSATASLLSNGKVLFTLYGYLTCGADFSCNADNGAELYDPSTGVFTATSRMITLRGARTATRLPDSTVLIAGGGVWVEPCGAQLIADRRSGAELYDPAAGMFAPTGQMTDDRANHTATLLPDGTVLIAGGARWTSPFGSFGAFPTLASAELYRPAVLAPASVVFSLSQDRQRR
jgi:hypothetical protein